MRQQPRDQKPEYNWLTPAGTTLVDVTVVVKETVLVLVQVEVFGLPSKQEHALLIFDVNGCPLPHPAPMTLGTKGRALSSRSLLLGAPG